MKPSRSTIAVLAAALAFAAPAVWAGPGHTHVAPAHGGQVVESGAYHVEWVLKDGTLAIYLSDAKGVAVAAKGHTGSVLVMAADGRKGPFTLAAGEANKMTAAGVPAFAPPASAILTLTDAKGAAHQFKLK